MTAPSPQLKKGGLGVGPTKLGKGTKIMAICDRSSLPVAVGVASASKHEVTLVEATLTQRFTEAAPKLLVADKAYDSDPHDERMKEVFDVELIAPHRRNRTKPKTQDGRKVRRYKKRWKIERLNAWLQNYKRIDRLPAAAEEAGAAIYETGCCSAQAGFSG